jgi:hypothetical protein
MAEKYFEKFPVITYANNQAVDITKRVALLERVSTNPYVFYPYEITSNERADQLSARYYNDAYRSWIFYISNKIVDPYYEWYLDENQFNEFIEKKYGYYIVDEQRILFAQTKIKYYRNNWEKAIDSSINVSEFDALPPEAKVYFEPVYSDRRSITSYKRAELNWSSGTNEIAGYTVNATPDQISSFKPDEIVTIVYDPITSGNGQFMGATSNTVALQHMRGSYATSNTVIISNTSYMVGTESNTVLNFTQYYPISKNIHPAVEMYWEGVTFYDYENEKNEYNKSIRVLDSSFRQTIADNLKDLMKV